MNATDSQKASTGTALVLAGLVANLGLTVLSYAVSYLVPHSYDGLYPIIEDLLWLGAVGVLAAGLFQLSWATHQLTLLQVTAAALVVNALVDSASTVLRLKFETVVNAFGPLLYDGTATFSLVARCLLLWCLVRLSMKTHAWVLPLLATVGLLTVMRTALSLAMMHNLIDGLYSSPVFRFGTLLLSLFNAGALVVGALAVKASMSATPDTPGLVAAAGLRPSPAAPEAPIADFLVGGILLAVGVGVTVVSLAASSNGGRYVVATGAITVGIVRIIRGFVRMARASG